jgi:hypothetical protein
LLTTYRWIIILLCLMRGGTLGIKIKLRNPVRRNSETMKQRNNETAKQ